jgi:hypothetical protein
LYRHNKNLLNKFVDDKSSEFLLKFFLLNGGLLVTDPYGEKPRCRFEAMENILQLCRTKRARKALQKDMNQREQKLQVRPK